MTSPYLFLPKRVGASLVTNSLPKCIGGHGNALGGAVPIRDSTTGPAMRTSTGITGKAIRPRGASSRFAREDCVTQAPPLGPTQRIAWRSGRRHWSSAWSARVRTRCSSHSSCKRIRRSRASTTRVSVPTLSTRVRKRSFEVQEGSSRSSSWRGKTASTLPTVCARPSAPATSATHARW
jgi:hypothetical protein